MDFYFLESPWEAQRENKKLTPIFYRENQTRCTVKFYMVIRYFELFPHLDPRDRDLENYYLSPPAEHNAFSDTSRV